VHGEADLGWNENINQLHLDQGDFECRDGEMNLASTNEIDQRWSHTGSRTDRESDAFPYDPPNLSRKVCDLPHETRDRVEAELRVRQLGESSASNIIELARWRR
jgi:hypothetical protein